MSLFINLACGSSLRYTVIASSDAKPNPTSRSPLLLKSKHRWKYIPRSWPSWHGRRKKKKRCERTRRQKKKRTKHTRSFFARNPEKHGILTDRRACHGTFVWIAHYSCIQRLPATTLTFEVLRRQQKEIDARNIRVCGSSLIIAPDTAKMGAVSLYFSRHLIYCSPPTKRQILLFNIQNIASAPGTVGTCGSIDRAKRSFGAQ